jgi:hypothetical protein
MPKPAPWVYMAYGCVLCVCVFCVCVYREATLPGKSARAGCRHMPNCALLGNARFVLLSVQHMSEATLPGKSARMG